MTDFINLQDKIIGNTDIYKIREIDIIHKYLINIMDADYLNFTNDDKIFMLTKIHKYLLLFIHANELTDENITKFISVKYIHNKKNRYFNLEISNIEVDTNIKINCKCMIPIISDIPKQETEINLKIPSNFLTIEDRDEFYNKNRQIMNNFTKELKKKYDQYELLINLPQPAQKSKEWFDLRNGMITASNCGAVIGECKHQTIKSVLLDKIGLGEKYKENKFVYHGKKYEKIAIMIYEIIYNSKVGEFGLIQHQHLPFLGASPDGISMSLTLDGRMNNMIGRMLEIKCPPNRQITNIGTIKGSICPEYYWDQVQIQLECCNLDECDFWQCHIIEYNTETEFINDDINDEIHTENMLWTQNEQTQITEKPIKKYIDKRIRKGMILEMLPINRSHIPKTDLIEWYGKYIYPPSILKTPAEYKEWEEYTIKNMATLYPKLIKEYKYSRTVYWKLILSHNELIIRQPNWFNTHKHMFETFWNRVLYYRTHMLEAQTDIVNQRLSNEVFLQTITNKIPKIDAANSLKMYKNNSKNNSSDENSSHKCKQKQSTVDVNNLFLNSSEESPKINNNPKIKIDILVPDVNSTKNIINNENDNDNDNENDLDLVIVKENRKRNIR